MANAMQSLLFVQDCTGVNAAYHNEVDGALLSNCWVITEILAIVTATAVSRPAQGLWNTRKGGLLPGKQERIPSFSDTDVICACLRLGKMPKKALKLCHIGSTLIVVSHPALPREIRIQKQIWGCAKKNKIGHTILVEK